MNKRYFISLVKLCALCAFTLSTTTLFAQQTLKYSYDALGRLVVENDTVNGDRNFAYDAAGNRTQVTAGNPALPTVPAKPTSLSCIAIPNINNRYTASWASVVAATSYIVTSSTGSVTVSAPTVTTPLLGNCLNVKACNASGCSLAANF